MKSCHTFLRILLFSLVLLGSFAVAHSAQAATKYWVGGNGDNVGTNANDWSTTDPASCADGAGDASAVPGASDIAVFDADCDNNATIAANWSVAGLTLSSGYTGTTTQSAAFTLTVGSSNFSQADGTFTGGSGTIDINGTFALSGGSFTSTSGTLSVSSTFTISGSPIFTHNSGTVVFDTNATNVTVTPSTATFNNVNISAGGYTKTIANSQTLTVVGTLTLTDGVLNHTTIPDEGSIAAQGDITQASTFDAGSTGRIEITGTANQTLTGGGSTTAGSLPGIEIDKSGGTLTLASIIRTTSNWTYTAGTIDAGSSTVVFRTPASSFTITGSHTLNNVIFDFPSGYSATIANNDTLTVTGTLTLTDGSINQTTVPAGGSIAAQGNITQASTFDGGSGRVEITGSSNQTFTGGGSGGALPNIEIDKSGGILTLASTIRTNTDWTYTAGTVDPGTSTVIFGTNNANSITITGSQTLYNVTLNVFSGFFVTIANSNTLTVTGTLTLSNGAIAQTTIPAGGSIAAQGDITAATTYSGGATGKITISGTANQTFTGGGSTSAGNVPDIEIN